MDNLLHHDCKNSPALYKGKNATVLGYSKAAGVGLGRYLLEIDEQPVALGKNPRLKKYFQLIGVGLSEEKVKAKDEG